MVKSTSSVVIKVATAYLIMHNKTYHVYVSQCTYVHDIWYNLRSPNPGSG